MHIPPQFQPPIQGGGAPAAPAQAAHGDLPVSTSQLDNARSALAAALQLMQQAESRLLESSRDYSTRIFEDNLSPDDPAVTPLRDGILQEFAHLEHHLGDLRQRVDWLSSQVRHLRAALNDGREALATIQPPAGNRFEAAWRMAIQPRVEQLSRNASQSLSEGRGALRVGREMAAQARAADVILFADLHRWAEQGGPHQARSVAKQRILVAREHAGFASLDFRNLGLTTLPRMMGHLHNVAYLDLSHNPFGDLPPDLGDMEGLRTLVCEGPAFNRVPDVVWKLHPDCVVHFDELDPEAQAAAVLRAEQNGGPRLVFHPRPSAPPWPADQPFPPA